ncbi:MAG: GNAT family N-acetyltransferase, partial [Hyphomonadaceae bacterium]|nr:GNAT family N-acetyltransferase [Hyphomonadaceae bacterium]
VNAVWPLEWRGDDIGEAIDDVEHWYEMRGLPPRFKLTDGAFAPASLPSRLERRGYEPVMPTLVMTRDLRAAAGAHEDVAISSVMPDLFDQALRRSTTNPDDLAERRSIARRLPSPAAFAVREHGGRPLAVGASAIADALAGIFLMRTVPDARRQGHGLHILRALLYWAKDNGAAHAFLQVDADNAPAIALYEREGFTRLTMYHFWRKRP